MSLRSVALLLGTAWLSLGCALIHAPEATSRVPNGPLPSDYAWPPKTLSEASSQASPQLGKAQWQAHPADPARATQPSAQALVPPANTGSCLNELTRSGVSFSPLGEKRGVVTPVLVQSNLGGVRYVPTGGLPLIVDCRFAVTLERLGPLLRELGVSALHYSGAYVYRMSSKGRLSLHANGLAIDIHEITVDGQQLSVKRDFARGLGDACGNNAPPLNRVACHLKRSGAFKELLTPDYNADHHDHIHLAIAPAAQTLEL